jgi:hypothetical protein
MTEQESISQLRIDILVAHLLLFVAKAGKPGEPNSDVCFYLGNRYLRLAEKYQRSGASSKSLRLRGKAEKYLGPLQGPPYAAAMAMPIPRRPTFTAAIGWRTRKGPPDDAA